MPTLAEVLARPEAVDALAVDVLLQLQQELGHLRVDVDAAVARHLARQAGPVPAPAGAVMGVELTVVDVAARFGFEVVLIAWSQEYSHVFMNLAIEAKERGWRPEAAAGRLSPRSTR